MVLELRNYTKKPLEVTSAHFTGGVENGTDIQNWIRGLGGGATWKPRADPWQSDDGSSGHEGWPEVIQIVTREGIMEAVVDDYVIQEPYSTDDRKFYPCKPDIFENSYILPGIVVDQTLDPIISQPIVTTYVDMSGSKVSQDIIDAPIQTPEFFDPVLAQLNANRDSVVTDGSGYSPLEDILTTVGNVYGDPIETDGIVPDSMSPIETQPIALEDIPDQPFGDGDGIR